jgi:hypothetical protein
MAVKKSLVWELPEHADAVPAGPLGVGDGVTFGDADSVGGTLDGVAGIDGLADGFVLGDTVTGRLAEAVAGVSVSIGTVGTGVDGAPHAALPAIRRKKAIGRRTSVTPGRARCTA